MADWRDGGGKNPKQPAKKAPRGNPRPAAPKKKESAKARPGWNAGGAAAGTGGSGWKRKSNRKPLPRAVIVTGWVTAFVLLIGALIAYLLSQHTRVPVISLAVTSYKYNSDHTPVIHPNSWGQSDVDHLAKAMDGGGINSANLEHFTAAESFITKDRFSQLLRSSLNTPLTDGGRVSRGGGPSKGLLNHSQNLVVYLSVHMAVASGAGGDNEPHFLLSDADPYDSNTWLPMRSVLKDLENWRKEEGFVDTQIVLMLDCGRMATNSAMGIFESRVPGAIEGLIGDLKPKNLVVMTSHSDNERSWAAPELRGSIFGQATLRALNGEADTSPKDDYVSCDELFNFVQESVGRWVLKARSAKQTPRRFTADVGDDFVLVSNVGAKTLESAGDARVDGEHAKTLTGLWSQLEEKLARGGRQLDPLGIAQLERMLTHMETLLFAGNEYSGEFESVAGKAQGLANSRLSYEGLPHTSFAFDALYHQKPTAKDVAVVDAQKQIADFNPEKPPEGFQEDGYIRRLAAWDWLSNKAGGCTKAELMEAHRYAKANQSTQFGNVESQFINMLAGLPDHANQTNQSRLSSLIQTAIRCRSRAEKIAAVNDLRLQYWVRRPTNLADAQRRRAEDLLYVGGTAGLDESQKIYQQLMSESDGNYRVAEQIATRIQTALATRDDAFSQVPHLLSPEFKLSLDQVTAAVESVSDLSRKLDEVPENDDELVQTAIDIERLQQNTRSALTSLATELRTKAEEYNSGKNEVSGNDCGFIIAILGNPVVVKGRENMRDNLSRFFESGKNPFNVSDVEDGTSADEIPPNTLQSAYLEKLTGRLLPDQWDDPGQMKQGEAFRARLNHVRATAEGLTRKSAESYKSMQADQADVTRQSLMNAEQLMRSIIAFRPDSIVGDDPGVARANLDLSNLCLWQAERFLDDYWGPDPLTNDRVTPWFVDAVSGCLGKARDNFSHTRCQVQTRDLDSILVERTRIQREESVEAYRPGGSNLKIPKSDSALGAAMEIRLKVPRVDRPEGRAAFFFTKPDGTTAALAADGNETPLRRIGFDVGEGLDATEAASRRITLLRSNDILPTEVDLTTVYRGHSIIRRVTIQELTDQYVERTTAQPPYRDAIVTVERPNVRPILNFVFDCSGSMNKKTGGVSRGDLCRQTMLNLLNKMDNRSYVGMFLYGHRIKYIKRPTGGFTTVKSTLGRKHPNTPEKPAWDFEQAIPIDRLTRRKVRDISFLLNNIEFDNGGETPLYASIYEALDQLESKSKTLRDQPLHLVVMTDGKNLPSSYQAKTNPKTTTSDIERKLRNLRDRGADIRFDLIAVDFKGISEQLTNLATESFYIRTDGAKDRLASTFEKVLGLYPYTVVERGGTKPLFTKRVGDSFNLECRKQRIIDVTLDAYEKGKSTKTLVVNGNETIRLLVDEPRGNQSGKARLVLPHFEADSVDDAVTRESYQSVPGDEVTYRVTAHSPRRDGEFVRFPISIQDAAADPESFRRPLSVHAEITPLVGGKPATDQMTVHYDPVFSESRPVGVIPWKKRIDSPDSGLAEIKMWFRADRVQSDHSEIVADHASANGLDQAKELQPTALRGLGFFKIYAGSRNGQYVVEVLNQGNESPDDVRVELSQRADSVVRRYYSVPKNQTLHEFTFKKTPENLAELRVIFTKTESFKAGALSPPKPITIRFPAG